MNALQYLFVLAINVGPKDTRKCMCFKPKAKPEKFFPSKKKEKGNEVLLATCNEYQQIFMSHTCLTLLPSLSIPLWPSLSRFLSGFSLVFPPSGEEVANTPTVHDRDND